MKVIKFFWRSFRLFTAFGVPAYVHTTFLVFPVGAAACYAWKRGGFPGIVIGVTLLGLLLACALVHEYAHICVGRIWGARTKRILLMPFVCAALMESLPPPQYEIAMALAGPIASFVLAGIAWCMSQLCAGIRTEFALWAGFLIGILAVFNLVLGGFNLLPVFPMDGGRVLRGLMFLFLRRSPCRTSAEAHILATRLAVRYVAYPTAVLMAVTVFWTHFWPHLLMFAALLVAAEAEYFMLRAAQDPAATSAPAPACEPVGTQRTRSGRIPVSVALKGNAGNEIQFVLAGTGRPNFCLTSARAMQGARRSDRSSSLVL